MPVSNGGQDAGRFFGIAQRHPFRGPSACCAGSQLKRRCCLVGISGWGWPGLSPYYPVFCVPTFAFWQSSPINRCTFSPDSTLPPL